MQFTHKDINNAKANKVRKFLLSNIAEDKELMAFYSDSKGERSASRFLDDFILELIRYGMHDVIKMKPDMIAKSLSELFISIKEKEKGSILSQLDNGLITEVTIFIYKDKKTLFNTHESNVSIEIELSKNYDSFRNVADKKKLN